MAMTNAEMCARYYAKKMAELKRLKRLEEDVLRERELERERKSVAQISPKKPIGAARAEHAP
jgi:hypothetical protein